MWGNCADPSPYKSIIMMPIDKLTWGYRVDKLGAVVHTLSGAWKQAIFTNNARETEISHVLISHQRATSQTKQAKLWSKVASSTARALPPPLCRINFGNVGEIARNRGYMVSSKPTADKVENWKLLQLVNHWCNRYV